MRPICSVRKRRLLKKRVWSGLIRNGVRVLLAVQSCPTHHRSLRVRHTEAWNRYVLKGVVSGQLASSARRRLLRKRAWGRHMRNGMAGLLVTPLIPTHRPMLRRRPAEVRSRRVTEGVDSGQHESSLSGPSCAEMLGLALRVCRFLRVRPRGKGQRRLIVEAAVYVASRFQLEAHRLCCCESQPCCGCHPPHHRLQ